MMELTPNSIRKLKSCDERLHILFKEAIKESPFEFIITHGYRTPEEQKKLYDQGRTTPGEIVTYLDGVNKKSKHNEFPSQAVDICIMIDGEMNWNIDNYITVAGHIKKVAADLGIKISYGGDWLKFKDYPHYQI